MQNVNAFKNWSVHFEYASFIDFKWATNIWSNWHFSAASVAESYAICVTVIACVFK